MVNIYKCMSGFGATYAIAKGFMALEDNGDEDESDDFHTTHFWMLHSRAEDWDEFNDLLDEATDADIGFGDWMCEYGADLLMELELGARDD